MMRASRIRWMGNVACMSYRKMHAAVFAGRPEGKELRDDQGIDLKMILKMPYKGFDARQEQEILLFSKRRPDRLWGPHRLLFNS
jgi:hypothetical protein